MAFPGRSRGSGLMKYRGQLWWSFVVLLLFPVFAGSQGPALPSPAETLTLEQAVQLALGKNPELRAVEDGASAARARVGQAQAARYPRVDFAQGFTRGNNPVYVFGTLLTQRQFTQANFALSSLNAPTPLDNFQTRLEGAMLLFDSGRSLLRV